MHTHTRTILITGANGEVGRGLVKHFASLPDAPQIITLDLNPLDVSLQACVTEHVTGSILDKALLADLNTRYTVDTIFHMAALLSTTGEKYPALAHDVNVNGTVNLLELAVQAGKKQSAPVTFIYPSSIAVYGLPDLATKNAVGAVSEDVYLQPTTMYGVNKLYGEHIGRYYSQHFGQFENNTEQLDFRGVRFPGLISAETVPSGGTSDYGPEMIHSIARGDSYTCFVREDTRLPFMTMPDAVRALTLLADADRFSLSRTVYNVTSFSLTAGNFANIVRDTFPTANITFAPDSGRQAIVDTWAADLNDSAARADWSWHPIHDYTSAFKSYLFPQIQQRYSTPELT
ncbi:MAG: NAD-dependent epimerase/dehydratase family protein [Chloroflexota bacterium]